jgi:hypothetical protein
MGPDEKRKKSSLQISLALIASVAFASCGEKGSRPIYKSLDDCKGEWGASDCDAIPGDSSDYGYGRYYGRFHSAGMYTRGMTSKATGIASVTRGGFGGSSGFHSSGGRS